MAYTDYFDEVQSIYIAYYQRPADPAGLRYWAQRLNAEGGNLDAIIDAFSNSPEAKSLYTETDPLKLVDSVYQALFGRPADNGADNFYVKALEAGKFPDGRPATLGRVAIDVLNGAQGDDRVAIDNKLKGANDFTQIVDGRPLTDPEFGFDGLAVTYKGDADAAAAREFLKGVTSDPSTVPTQDGVKEVVAEKIADPTDAPVETGKTFTLTTNLDNVQGTIGNDTINGDTATLTAADVINGGAGIDTLNVTVTAGTAVLNGADVKSVEILNVRNVGTGAAAVDASQVVGLTEVNSDRSTGTLTVTNLAAGATLGLKGNGVAALGNVTGSYVAAATAANIVVDGGTGAASAGVTVLDGAGLTSATITGKGGVNALTGVAFGTGAGTADNVKAVTIDAQSNLTTGNITGLAAASTITVKGAGTANIGTLQATNVTSVDASANTGGVTATLNDVTTLKFVGGAGNDVLTTGAVLATGASVDAGAGTADRLVVANTAHITAAAGKFYKGFEQLQVQDGVTVDVTQLADGNTIDTIRINDGTGATGVTNLSAAQAAAVSILATGAAGAGAITIGVKDASAAGQIDTVKAALTTTTAAGVAQNIDLTNLVLTGVEKLELTGNGTAAATTGTVTLTTAAATSLDSIIVKNAGENSITIDGGQTATNLVVDASGSTGNTTIDASLYATTTGAKLLGGSGHDVLLGSALADKIVGGAGNDVISGAATVTVGTAATATANAILTAIGAPSGYAADVLTGGAGRDVFAFGASGAGNTIANISSITDLDFGGTTLATGGDQIYFDGATAGAATIVTLTAAQQTAVTAAANLAAAVDLVSTATNSAANNVAQFTYGADTYLYINGAAGGTAYVAGEDLLVKITGVVGTLDASDIVII